MLKNDLIGQWVIAVLIRNEGKCDRTALLWGKRVKTVIRSAA